MPDLDGPRARIERAQGQIEALHAAFQGFFERNPYRVVLAEFDANTRRYSLRVQGEAPPFPREWSLSIGEIAHNLRSALDGLTWQLALLPRHAGAIPVAPYEWTAFPIFRIGHTKSKHRIIRRFGRGGRGRILLQSVPRRLWACIEGFQPYKRGNRGRRSPLFLLQELNNSDKHRLVTVLTTMPAGYRLTGLWGAPSRIYYRVQLHPNAKVGYVSSLPPNGAVLVIDPASGRLVRPQNVQVDVNVTPAVFFGDGCDPVKRLPVIPTLKGMADEVSRIVELFSDEF